MHKYNLGFISDKDFFNHVKEMVLRLTESIDLKKFSKNSIDPIKMTVEMHTYQISLEEAVSREIARQMGKTVENAIGWFHQNIFRYVSGWQIEDSIIMNHANNLYGVLAYPEQTHSACHIAEGIAIGNKSATIYIIVPDGSIVVAKEDVSTPDFTERIQRLSWQDFFNLAVRCNDGYAKLRIALNDALQDLHDDVCALQDKISSIGR